MTIFELHLVKEFRFIFTNYSTNKTLREQILGLSSILVHRKTFLFLLSFFHNYCTIYCTRRYAWLSKCNTKIPKYLPGPSKNKRIIYLSCDVFLAFFGFLWNHYFIKYFPATYNKIRINSLYYKGHCLSTYLVYFFLYFTAFIS